MVVSSPMASNERTSFFTIANLLSLARIPLAMLFAVSWVAPWGGEGWALGVLAAAALTDALDGIFARRAAARSAATARGGARGVDRGSGMASSYSPPPLAVQSPAGTGSWLDPICDKIFVATVLGTIWIEQHPPLKLLALILARELAQVPLSLLYISLPSLRRWLQYDFRASVLGKTATVAQFAAIAGLVMGMAWIPVLARVAFVTGMLALADYLWRAIRIGAARLQPHHPSPDSPDSIDGPDLP
jgi:phosphatidylglycerophosphate synthase